ncbi:MAG: RNA polymerase sigma-70 factor [Chitinophagaceae bacterium]|nr:RNA polymerase sigma-70 factor [Chitinophagaceae bacterium]
MKPTATIPDEKELLQKVAIGDQQAFALIVEKYTDVVYPYLIYWVKNAQLAEEITQDVFVRLWKNRHKLAAMDNFAGYVYVTTRNRANTALKAELLKFEESPEDKLYDPVNHPQSHLEAKELLNMLDRAIDSLPARRKQVFELSRKEDLTYEEIAEQLGISRSAVRQHIVEALVFLRHYIKEKTGIVVSLLTLWWTIYSKF